MSACRHGPVTRPGQDGRMRQTKSVGQNHSYGVLATVLVLAAACGGSSGPGTAGTTPSATAATDASMHHAALDVSNTRFGQILVDGQGRALYLFAADKTSASTCYDACATAWPPMVTDKGATTSAMHGVNASLAGTTARKDGMVQVTYNGHPLYYYEGDRPSEVKCQGVVNFGGAWYVVDPNGNAITTK